MPKKIRFPLMTAREIQNGRIEGEVLEDDEELMTT